MKLNTDFFFFYLGFMARQDYFIHFEPSQSLGGRIWRSPGMKKHMTTRKQNLTCLTCDQSKAQTHSGEMTSIYSSNKICLNKKP